MATAQEVGQAGKAHVVEQLQGRRFTIKEWNLESAGAADIDAMGGRRHVLVQVKTSVSPEAPEFLSGDEAAAIKERAATLGAEAWQARVTMNDNLTLNGRIAWRKVR